MMTTSQARGFIWDAIESFEVAFEGETLRGPAAIIKALPDDGLSLSMLYKFKPRETGLPSNLGPKSVGLLRPLLVGVPAEAWLAAMGIEGASAEVSL